MTRCFLFASKYNVISTNSESSLLDAAVDGSSQLDSTHSVAMDANSGDHMTKTIVIAVCCVVAYLGIMAALTVYCLVHMVRARKMRKLQTSNMDSDRANNPLSG